jgi:hypothetical protein
LAALLATDDAVLNATDDLLVFVEVVVLLEVLFLLETFCDELVFDDACELDDFDEFPSPLPHAVKNVDTMSPKKNLFISSIPWLCQLNTVDFDSCKSKTMDAREL